MMSTTKTRNFVNALSAGLTGAEAEDLLTPESLGGFRESLQWSTTRRHLLQSLDIMTTVIDSRKLLASFLVNQRLWAEFLGEESLQTALGQNADAVTQLLEYPEALNRAMVVPGVQSSAFSSETVITAIGVDEIFDNDGIWNAVASSEEADPAREWLYQDDDTRALSIFNTPSQWDKTATHLKPFVSFLNNPTALAAALDIDGVRFGLGSDAFKASVVEAAGVGAEHLKRHPRHLGMVQHEDILTKRALSQVTTHPMRTVYLNNSRQPTVIDGTGTVLYTLESWDIVGVTDYAQGTGFVCMKLHPAYAGQAARVVMEYYEWGQGYDPLASVVIPFASYSTSNNYDPMISPNGRYATFAHTSEIALVDLQTKSVVFVKDSSEISGSYRSHDVSDAGTVYAGTSTGHVVAFDVAGTELWEALSANGSGDIGCVAATTAAVLVAQSGEEGLQYLDVSDGSLIKTVATPGIDLTMSSGCILHAPSGSRYLWVGGTYYLIHIDASDTVTTMYNSSIRVGSGKPYLSPNGLIYKINNNVALRTNFTLGTIETDSQASEWLGDDYYVSGFIGHPTYPTAFASVSGVVVTNAELESIDAEWFPLPNYSPSRDRVKLDWMHGDLLLYAGQMMYLMDPDTGSVKGGFKPPFIRKDLATDESAVIMVNNSRVTCALSPAYERVYTSNSQYLMFFVEADGTIRWAEDRENDSGTSGDTDVIIHPEGYILLTTPDMLSRYSAHSGGLQETVSIASGGWLQTSFKDTVFVRAGFNSGELQCNITTLDDFSTVSTIPDVYKHSSNNRFIAQEVFGDYLLTIVTHLSTYGEDLVIHPINLDDNTLGDAVTIDDTWMSNNTTDSRIEGIAYDADTNHIHVFGVNSAWVLSGWQGELADIVVESSYPLTERPYGRYAAIRSNYSRPALSNW